MCECACACVCWFRRNRVHALVHVYALTLEGLSQQVHAYEFVIMCTHTTL